jgi:hypothetical protein
MAWTNAEVIALHARAATPTDVANSNRQKTLVFVKKFDLEE